MGFIALVREDARILNVFISVNTKILGHQERLWT